MKDHLTQIELFAGIGGFGLAGHWAGIETVCQVEIDPFCRKVLQKNFPKAERHEDIHTFNGHKYAGTIDIISGGFPCQPFSIAGQRKGTDDDRYLWPEMLRVIREVRPRWVVGENVTGLLTMDGGRVFDEVCAGLEDAGYTVEAFVIPACAVGAPHRRDRVWIIANTNGERLSNRERFVKQSNSTENFAGLEFQPKRSGQNEIIANTNGERCKELDSASRLHWQGFDTGNICSSWSKQSVEPTICRMGDGVSTRLDKYRNARIKALGNAIVPQVAYQIFSAIIKSEADGKQAKLLRDYSG